MRTAQQARKPTYAPRGPVSTGLRTTLFLGVALALLLQTMPLGVLGSHTPAHNNPPVLDPITDVTLDENKTVHIEFTGSDADADNVIFEITGKPAGAIFQQNTTYQAYFKWKPTFNQAGVYAVTIKLRDEYTTDSQTFNITVLNVNRAPTMGFLHNKWIEEFQDFDMQINAADPDGDALALTLEVNATAAGIAPGDLVVLPNARIPRNADFSDGGDGQGAFAWIPDCSQGAWDPPRAYPFWANVTDGTTVFSRTFTIYVIDVNAPPTLDAIPLIDVMEGDTINQKIIVRWCDGPVPENHFLDVGTVSAAQAGVTPPPLPPGGLPSRSALWLPGVTVDREDETPWHPGVPGANTQNITLDYDPVGDFYYGWFNWTNIGFQVAGNYTFYTSVYDGGLTRRTDNETGELGVQHHVNGTFTVRVNNVNTAPAILLPAFHDAPTRTYYGKEDTRFFQVSPLNALGDIWQACVADAENDVIFWSFDWTNVAGVQTPPGLVFTQPDPPVPAAASCVTIQWNFNYTQAGVYDFELKASDGQAVDIETFTIVVENTNRRPFIDPIPPQVVFENETVTVYPTGFDHDMMDPVYEDIVDVIATGLPAGSQWAFGNTGGSDSTIHFGGTFIWTPGHHQAGVHVVTLNAIDWDAFSELPATPLDPLTDAEYVNPPVVPVEPFEYNWTRSFSLTVLNVDRPPVCLPLLDQTWMVGTPIVVSIVCSDPDGDPIAIGASPLPAGAILTDFGDGTARIDWTPLPGDNGIYDIDVTAYSGAPVLTYTDTVRIVVVMETDFALGPIGSAFPRAVPGVPETLNFFVKNTALLGTDLLTFTATATNGAVPTAPAPIFVTAGQPQTNATFTVTVPPSASSFVVTLKAQSTLDPALVKQTSWRVDVFVNATITMTNTLPGLVTGFVQATYDDGSPVANLALTATQRPLDTPNPFGLLTTSVSGTTDNAGVFQFSFVGDAAAGVPGEHELRVSGAYFGRNVSATTTYSVP